MAISSELRSRLAYALGADHAAKELQTQSFDTPTYTGGAAAAAVVQRFGATVTEGLEVRVIDEIVTTTNAVENNLTNVIPSGSVILCVQANLNTLIVGDGTGDNLFVKVGIGVTATPNKYGITADLLKNTKSDWIHSSWTVLGANEQIVVKTAVAAGTAATEKFVAGGKIRVRVVFLAPNSLDDAA